MVSEVDILDRVFLFLAGFPSPVEVLEFHTTELESARVKYLTERSKSNKISNDEMKELKFYFRAEKYIRLAKANALMMLNNKTI